MAGPWPGRAFQKVRGRGGEPATSRCGLSELCVWLGLRGVGMGGWEEMETQWTGDLVNLPLYVCEGKGNRAEAKVG